MHWFYFEVFFFCLQDVQLDAEIKCCIPFSFLQNMKTQLLLMIHSSLDGLVVYARVYFRFHSFYEQLKDFPSSVLWIMFWKPLQHICSFLVAHVWWFRKFSFCEGCNQSHDNNVFANLTKHFSSKVSRFVMSSNYYSSFWTV